MTKDAIEPHSFQADLMRQRAEKEAAASHTGGLSLLGPPTMQGGKLPPRVVKLAALTFPGSVALSDLQLKTG